jgi:hypothetical protein
MLCLWTSLINRHPFYRTGDKRLQKNSEARLFVLILPEYQCRHDLLLLCAFLAHTIFSSLDHMLILRVRWSGVPLRLKRYALGQRALCNGREEGCQQRTSFVVLFLITERESFSILLAATP